MEHDCMTNQPIPEATTQAAIQLVAQATNLKQKLWCPPIYEFNSGELALMLKMFDYASSCITESDNLFSQQNLAILEYEVYREEDLSHVRPDVLAWIMWTADKLHTSRKSSLHLNSTTPRPNKFIDAYFNDPTVSQTGFEL